MNFYLLKNPRMTIHLTRDAHERNEETSSCECRLIPPPVLFSVPEMRKFMNTRVSEAKRETVRGVAKCEVL